MFSRTENVQEKSLGKSRSKTERNTPYGVAKRWLKDRHVTKNVQDIGENDASVCSTGVKLQTVLFFRKKVPVNTMNKSKVPAESRPDPQQVVRILESILPSIANNSNSPHVLDKVC